MSDTLTEFRQGLFRYNQNLVDTCATAKRIIETIHENAADWYDRMLTSEIVSDRTLRLGFLGNKILVTAEVLVSEPPLGGNIVCRLETADADKPVILDTAFTFDSIGNINETLSASACAHKLIELLYAEVKGKRFIYRG